MSNALENTSDADSFENKRIVYVPPAVDWDTMYNHAVKLFNTGCSVWVHDHGYQARCTPNGRCGQLTAGPGGAILVPDSSTDN